MDAGDLYQKNSSIKLITVTPSVHLQSSPAWTVMPSAYLLLSVYVVVAAAAMGSLYNEGYYFLTALFPLWLLATINWHRRLAADHDAE